MTHSTPKGMRAMTCSGIQDAKSYFIEQLRSVCSMAGLPGVSTTHSMLMECGGVSQWVTGWQLDNVPLTQLGLRCVFVDWSGSLYLVDDGVYELPLVRLVDGGGVFVHSIITLESIITLVERLEVLILSIHFDFDLV